MHITDYEMLARALYETKPIYRFNPFYPPDDAKYEKYKVKMQQWTEDCKKIAAVLDINNANFEPKIFLDYCWEGSYDGPRKPNPFG